MCDGTPRGAFDAHTAHDDNYGMKQVWIVAFAAAVVLGAMASPAAAQQLERKVQRTGDTVEFEIRFRDTRMEPRVLKFALPTERYRAATQGLTRLDSGALSEEIRPSVEAYIARSRDDWQRALTSRLDALSHSLPQGVTMRYDFENGRLNWKLRGAGVSREELERVSARLKQRIGEASERLMAAKRREVRSYATRMREQAIREMNYVRDPGLDNVLRPDYRGIARDAAPVIEPLAEAIAREAGIDARARTALALAFLQGIPYDELTDRNAADGTGFAVPAEMLEINLGDCDSKATALAALMQHFAPEVDTAIVLLPGHAVLAAELDPLLTDKTIELRGKTFVLMEPAGPGVLPLGQVDPRSWRMLQEDGPTSVVWMNG